MRSIYTREPSTFRYENDPVKFIRKGRSGGWRSHLNEVQSKKINAKFQAYFKGTEAENWWPQEMTID